MEKQKKTSTPIKKKATRRAISKERAEIIAQRRAKEESTAPPLSPPEKKPSEENVPISPPVQGSEEPETLILPPKKPKISAGENASLLTNQLSKLLAENESKGKTLLDNRAELLNPTGESAAAPKNPLSLSEETEKKIRQKIEAAKEKNAQTKPLPRPKRTPPSPKEAAELDAILSQEQQKQYRLLAMGLVVSVLLAFTFTLVQYFSKADANVTSLLYLDVNPSMMISLNKNNEVIELSPLNTEGETLLQSTNFQGLPLEDTLVSLLDLLNDQGYLQNNCTILATIQDEKQSRGEALSIEVKEMLDRNTPNSNISVMGMWTAPELDQLSDAEALDISLGKMILLEELSQVNYFFQTQTLLPFTNGELYQLYASGATTIPIGMEKASSLAQEAVSLWDQDNFAIEIQAHLTESTPYYQVHFQLETMEYMVKVHGFSGNIQDSLQREMTSSTLSLGLTGQEAKEIALSHAQKLAIHVEKLALKQDWAEGWLQYIVTFQLENQQHKIVVHGVTGEIMSYTTGAVPPESITDLGQTQIQDLVFSDAGVTRSAITAMDFQRNIVEGVAVYDLNFLAGAREFFYEITGDGTILFAKQINHGEEEEPPEEESSSLTETEAKDLALDHAGVSFSQITQISASTDEEENFIVEFVMGDFIYHYEISAQTKEVLSYEKQEKPEELQGDSSEITEEVAKRVALADANLKEVMIESFDITKGENNQFQVAFSFSNFNFYYEISGTTGEILKNEKTVAPAVLEPEPIPPETDPVPELNTDSFDEIMENFNNMVSDFNAGQSSW
ncbi:MAG: hypothetical protein R3Y63_06920 [Eubacteriales bacterium]